MKTAPPRSPRVPPAGLRPDDAGAAELVEALVRVAFTGGEQPFAREVAIPELRPGADLIPPGATLVRRIRFAQGRTDLFVTAASSVLVSVWQRSARVFAASRDEAALDAIVDGLLADAAVPPRDRPADVVDIGFWHLGPHHPEYRRKAMAAPAWSEVRGNYTASTAVALDGLMGWAPAGTDGGRLVLLHGPPGTGKTTLVRALARAWRAWCDADVVLDPDVLFGSIGYLYRVALEHQPAGGEEEGRWRLLVLEDCDELIRADAKSGAGQHLSRLLNVTDGLVGQGTRLLVAVTTNEPLSRLHPAVTRPGRCLAELEVGRLTRAEAAAWLAGAGGDGGDVDVDGIGPGGATLAELYERRSGAARFAADEPADRVGAYL